MTSDEYLSFSDRFDTRQNALRPKRGLLLRRLLIHRLKNLAHCVGLGGLNSFVVAVHILLSVCKSCMCKQWIYFNSCRVKEYVQMGLDTIIIDPDKGANIERKLDRLQKSGVNDNVHINLRTSPELPKTG